MKKLLLVILLATAGYFAYAYLINKKVLEIEANKMISTGFSMDAEAPALFPTYSGSIHGTVKNISDKAVRNILIKYKLDGRTVEAIVYSLEPGEQCNFTTPNVKIRSDDVSFYLEKLSYE